MNTTKIIITQLFILSFLSSCNLSKDKNDLLDLHLKGNVESVTEKTFFKFSYKEAEGGNKIVIEDGDYNSENLYNLKTWEFNGDGNIEKIYEKQIKDDANLDKNMVNQTEIRKYDMMGRLKEVINTFGDGSTGTATSNYSFMSKLCTSTKDVLGETTYKYDDKGNEIEVSNPLFGTTKTQYTYNQRGWLTNKTITDSSGVVQSKIDYDLDADGKLMYETTFSPDGKEIEKKEYLSGVLSKTIKTEYGGYEHSFNDNEDLIIDISYKDEKHEKQSSKQVYQYEYDENGNWIKRIKCDHYGWKKVPAELTIREIKY